MHGVVSYFKTPSGYCFSSAWWWLFLLSHPSCPWLSNSAIAQDKSPAQLVQDGVDAYQQGDYSTAIATWNQALEAYPPEAPAERALINQNLARAYHQIGFSPEAINSWEAAAAIYRQGGDTSQVGRMLTEQAQVYLSMGQYRRAIALLCLPKSDTDPADCESGTALPIATATNDSLGKVAALGSLGEAYRLRGRLRCCQDLFYSRDWTLPKRPTICSLKFLC